MTTKYNNVNISDECNEKRTNIETHEIIQITDSDNNDIEIEEKPNENENKVQVFNHIPKRSVPNANVPEKIIICIDVCENTNVNQFELTSEGFPTLALLKKIVGFFLYSKQAINSNSEFALVILRELKPVWAHNFTKNIIEIIMDLNCLNSELCNKPEFDLSLLFDLIYDKVDFPELFPDYKLVPPMNVVRLIVMYNRSDCVPKLMSNKEIFDLLKNHPYFTIDILYSHEENCNEHKCAEIYDSLQSLDNGYSYIFEVSKDEEKFHECGAKLLAHPLQRPLQQHSSYSFFSDSIADKSS